MKDMKEHWESYAKEYEETKKVFRKQSTNKKTYATIWLFISYGGKHRIEFRIYENHNSTPDALPKGLCVGCL